MKKTILDNIRASYIEKKYSYPFYGNRSAYSVVMFSSGRFRFLRAAIRIFEKVFFSVLACSKISDRLFYNEDLSNNIKYAYACVYIIIYVVRLFTTT